ncbi:flagellar biosynthetic protein FliR [bacterium]|nr:flagellar biosynthetic protein FliR [bacterium]
MGPNLITQIGTMFPVFDAAVGVGFHVFVRLLGFILMAPVFNRKEVPNLIKLSFAFIFAITLTPVLHTHVAPANNSLFLSITLNIAVGAMLGYMAQLILLAINSGADMINMQMGLSSAMVLDPTTQSQVSILEKMFGLFAILIFIQLGGIYWLIQAFMRSFQIFPIFATHIPLDKLVNMDYLIQMTSNVLYMGLQIASPILLATLAQDIILGVISKTAPQVNVFQLSFLFKPVLGAAIMVWILPMLVNVISDYFLSFSHII